MIRKSSISMNTGITLLALLLTLFLFVRNSSAHSEQSGQSAKPVQAQQSGRYQIVNGTPELSKNIMLLDTQTGRSWVSCTVDGQDAWCSQHRYDEGETIPKAQEK